MGRKSRGSFEGVRNSPILIKSFIAFCALYITVKYAYEIMYVITIIVAAAVTVFVSYLFYRRQRRAEMARRLPETMEQHKAALVAYFRQSISKDAFGNIDDSHWQKRIDAFLQTQVVPDVTNYPRWRASRPGREAVRLVDNFAQQKDVEDRVLGIASGVEPDKLTPSDYERHCADVLEHLGWRVQMTPASRDHGADVIAEKSGRRLVIQCKRYSQPVGNKAVQEVHAARHLYGGCTACVVAPQGFTAQARREAHGLSVILLHHSELGALGRQLEDESS